jgi:tRNA (guanine37-N1)-methyltransferase
VKIDVLTIFPGMFEGPLTESLIQRARDKKIVEINILDIRSFTTDKHHTADDSPYGGGPGMVMKIEPVYRALKNVKSGAATVILLSPQGKTLNHKIVNRLVGKKKLVLICGHYEGFDERISKFVDEEISIGDYVLTGGEIPAAVLIDAVVRQLPGVVKESDSVKKDSFYSGLLDYPHYTRPSKFLGMSVPKVLLSGDHKKIESWRNEQALARTKKRRPDLIKNKK